MSIVRKNQTKLFHLLLLIALAVSSFAPVKAIENQLNENDENEQMAPDQAAELEKDE